MAAVASVGSADLLCQSHMAQVGIRQELIGDHPRQRPQPNAEPPASNGPDSTIQVSDTVAAPRAPKAAAAAVALFAGGLRRLTVVDDSGDAAEFFVHEGALSKLPYFAERKGDWVTTAEKGEWLHLPAHCPALSFGIVLTRLYSIDEHWSPADWVRVLGADLPAAYGVLLLLKMLLANDLVEEILGVIRQLASDTTSLEWLHNVVNSVDLPELESFCAKPGPIRLEQSALEQSALSALTGSVESHRLFEAILASIKEANGLTSDQVKVLISVLQNHSRYTTHGRIQSVVFGLWPPHVFGRYRNLSATCDFFRPTRIPAEGFGMIWKHVACEVEAEPALFQPALEVFRSLQWLEYDVQANRRGQESIAGSKRLRHLPENTSKQAIRKAYASFLLLGLRLKDRGEITDKMFLDAFSCGSLSSDQAPQGLGGIRRRNLLHFAAASRPITYYVDNLDVLATVLAGIDDNLRTSILSIVPEFRQWQWAFSARAIRSLSEEQQAHCVDTCTRDWLNGEVFQSLRGQARIAARAALMKQVGRLSKAQREFVWEGL